MIKFYGPLLSYSNLSNHLVSLYENVSSEGGGRGVIDQKEQVVSEWC